jgi:hypothetical protein
VARTIAIAKFIGQIKGVPSAKFNQVHPGNPFYWQKEYGIVSIDTRKLFCNPLRRTTKTASCGKQNDKEIGNISLFGIIKISRINPAHLVARTFYVRAMGF